MDSLCDQLVERKDLVNIAECQPPPNPSGRPALTRCSDNERVKGKTPWVNSEGKLQLKSLLVPVDFSDCSIKAVECANYLAKDSGACIDLLNVIEPARIPRGLKMPYGDWEDLMVRNSKSSLKQLAAEKIDRLIPVHSEVRIGGSYQEICEAASRQGQELIVIGTHGRTGLKHFFFGSTAERVVRFAPCSVLVVRGLTQTPKIKKPGKILVPVDFSRNSNLAVDAAAAIAREFGSALILSHILPSYNQVSESQFVDYATLEGELRESAQKELLAISTNVAEHGVPAATFLSHGRPATEIVLVAEQLKADLIVISTHGRTGIQHALLGSTTEQVVRHAGCPVLVLRQARQPDFPAMNEQKPKKV